MSNPFKSVVFAVMVSAVFSAGAGTTIYEFKDKAKPTHYFDDPGEYGNGTPTAGGWVQLAELAYDVTPEANRHSTVYVTNDWTVPLNYVILKGGTRTADDVAADIRFLAQPQGDAEHVNFAPGDFPGDSDVVYGVAPFEFGAYDAGDRSIARIGAGSNPDTRAAQYKFTDFDVTVGAALGECFLRFDRGAFNVYDPAGTAHPNAEMSLGITPAAIDFGPYVQLRLPWLKVAANAGSSAITFSGTQVDAFSGYEQNAGAVCFSDSARFSAGQLSLLNGCSMTVDGEGTSVSVSGAMKVENTGASASSRMIINDGAFSLTGEIAVNSNGRLVINGGNVNLKSTDGGNHVTLGWNTQNSVIQINGGTVSTFRVRQGRYTTAAGNSSSLIEVNGGEFIVGGYYNFHQNDTEAYGIHDLCLNGGVMKAPRFTRGVTPRSTTARIIGDGGTLQVTSTRNTAETPYVESVAHLCCGDGGFFLDTQNYTTYIQFPFENKDGERGVFVKKGYGYLVYEPGSETSVSAIRVAEGTFNYLKDEVASQTDVEVLDGATFSLEGDAKMVTFRSFKIRNGRIKAEAGDKICVTDAAGLQFKGLTIVGTDGSTLTAADIFVVAGETDAAAKKELMRTFAQSCSTNEHMNYTFTYDAAKGVTSIAVAKSADVTYSDSAIWTGSESGLWTNTANWNDGKKPTADANAVFGAGGANKTVTVAAGEQVGAVVFDEDGYSLNGEDMLVFSGEGGAKIEVAAEKSAAVHAPVSYAGKLTTAVAAGGELALNGAIGGGALLKTGAGRLVLAGDNDSVLGTVLANGTLAVKSAGAAGLTNDTMILKAGTLAFEGDEPMTLVSALEVNADSATDYTAIKTDCDVTLGSVNVRKGAFIKRGAGKLTIEVSNTAEDPMVLANAGGTISGTSSIRPAGSGLVFPEDGTAPVPAPNGSGQYPAFGIADGEVELKGLVDGAAAQMRGWTVIGLPTLAVPAARPVLTVNGVSLEINSERSWEQFLVGTDLGQTDVGMQDPTLNIINGGAVKNGLTSQFGYNSGWLGARMWFAATNGTFELIGGTYLTRAYNGDAKVLYRFRDSSLKTSGYLMVGGGIDLDFDNSFFGMTDGGAVSLVGESNRPNGTMVFRNKSVFAYAGFDEQSISRDLTITLDDAEWRPTADCSSATLAKPVTSWLHYSVSGVGAVLKPAADSTYTINAPIEGEGGIVVEGEGTVKLGTGAYAFSGVAAVKSGTLDLSDAGTVTGATFFGSGTISGVESLNGATIVLDLENDWSNTAVPTLSGAIGGKVIVKTGRTSENPVTYVKGARAKVATVANGATVDLSKWKLSKEGLYRASGQFIQEGNDIYVESNPPLGMGLVIR